MGMRTILLWVPMLLLVSPVRGSVRVYVQETNGLANINYLCTAGEVIRAFALDVTVDRGVILSVTNFFVGPSTVAAQGYGIFPASFRDHITVTSGTNANWNAPGYTPLAVLADNPGGTLGGLGTSGVTLEFGAIWDPTSTASAPPASGTLCALLISQTARITVAANGARGGVVAAPSDVVIVPQFAGALVGPAITSATTANGTITILFQDGELESAPTVNGPWLGTGNSTGVCLEAVTALPARFYRVHRH
jgi:hypothetical protein